MALFKFMHVDMYTIKYMSQLDFLMWTGSWAVAIVQYKQVHFERSHVFLDVFCKPLLGIIPGQ